MRSFGGFFGNDLVTPLGTEKMFGVWLTAAEVMLLGFDAQRAIALRAMKIAGGGYSARTSSPPPRGHATCLDEHVAAYAGNNEEPE
jgi:hypothetical protein